MHRESGGRLSAAALKWIAAAAMTADHIGIVFGAALPEWAAACLRIAGRVSLPLFCFFVAEGARRTRSRGKYALRLLAFAFASEIPFDLMLSGRPFDPLCQNVLFTLLFGLLVANTDETIQLLMAGRSSQLTDVWIDFSGVCAGLFVSLCLLLFLRMCGILLRSDR